MAKQKDGRQPLSLTFERQPNQLETVTSTRVRPLSGFLFFEENLCFRLSNKRSKMVCQRSGLARGFSPWVDLGTCSIHQRMLVVEIRDNGSGIPLDEVSRAFEPFVQLQRRSGENRTGFGLGLPLCRRQIEAMGGSLEIASVEGGGTTVRVTFPASRGE